MKTILITILIMIQSSIIASGVITVEKQTGQNIAGLIKLFKVKNNGQLPRSWPELRSVYDPNMVNRDMHKRYGYNIEDRYQFVDATMQAPDEKGSQVLLIRVVPLENRKRGLKGEPYRYRYMVVLQKDGSVWCSWYTEDSIQKMLTKAGVTITPPPGLPEVEYDTDPLDYVPPPDDIGGPAGQPSKTDASLPNTHAPLQPSSSVKNKADALVPSKTMSTNYRWMFWAIILFLTLAGGSWLLLRKRAK